MDLKLIARLVRMMEKADLTEIEIEEEGSRVHLRRGAEVPAVGGPVVHLSGVPSAAPAAPPGALAAPGAAGAGAPAAEAGGEVAAPSAAAGHPDAKPFPSPMVGTFYRSPSPEAEAFVEAGSKFGPDTVMCIIEAMKVMNEIKAELSGEVVAVLAENGEPVEFGQPLFLVKPA